MFQSENGEKPKIRFVKNVFFDAICLYWIDEIHINEKLKTSKVLDDIIKHELKHYQLFKKAIELKKRKKLLKLYFIMKYNDVWDFFSSLKIVLKSFLYFIMTKIKLVLAISQIILLFSALMDLALFFAINYHVPSWTISVMSILSTILIEMIKKYVYI